MNKRTKTAVKILLLLIIAIVVYMTIDFLYVFFTNAFKMDLGLALRSMASPVVLILTVCAYGAAGIFALINTKFRGSKIVLQRNEDLEDTHWLSSKEIKANPGLTVTNLKSLEMVNDGVPIFAEHNKNNIDVVLAKPIHTLVIGTTGSGKTSGFVDPTIQILSRTKSKPCLVITDPKGEIYLHHADTLKKQGYNVQVLDLNDIYRSTHWNPFNDIWIKTDRLNNLKIELEKGKYNFEGKAYLTYEEADKEKKVIEQQLSDEVYIDLQDLIYTICPVENEHDKTWQKGARDLIFALALAFWEDCRDGLMRREQFNLYNLYKNITLYSQGDCAELKNFFENRSKFSKTKGLANTVLVSQDRTLTSYLGDVNQYFNWMADNGIASLTSSNDIDFSKFDEAPTALFLKIPDARENRHKLVALFVTQIYKALVGKAGENQKKGKTTEETLLRSVYFILDEFGNMPKFHNIGQIVTVGRSRKIFIMPVIQDFNQLDLKYGKELAATIRDNCNIKIFIGTTDNSTIKEFSEMCGKHKVKQTSYTDSNDMSISTQAQEKPLIYPTELQKLNDPPHRMGNAIVLSYGRNPLKAKFTPVFQAKELYQAEDIMEESKPAEIFDESSVFYDINMRNNFIAETPAQTEPQVQENLNGLPEDDLYEQKVANEIERLIQEINDKCKSLENRIPKEEFAKLMRANIKLKVQILNDCIEQALKKGNKITMFQCTLVKKHIEGMLDYGKSA